MYLLMQTGSIFQFITFKINTIMTYKWKVTFTTPSAGGRSLTEIVEASQWSYAKAMLESKYSEIKILQYTPVK